MASSTVLYVALNGKEVTLVLLATYLIIAAVGCLALVLNAVVLDTMIRKTKMEATDFLVSNLAATDMLTGVLILHTVCYSLINFQNLSECVIRMGIVYLFVLSSLYHLALLTLDRFVKIVYPFRYDDVMSRRRVTAMSSAVWLFSINYGLLPLYGWRNEPPKGSEPPCSLLGILTTRYTLLGMVIVFLPLLVMSTFYCKIFLVARRHSRAIMALDVTGNTGTKAALRFTKVVLLLVGTYFLLFAPMATIALIFTLGGFPNMSAADVGDYIVYSSVLTFANSVVNPIIYAFKVPPVRKRFRQFFRRTELATDHAWQSAGPSQTVVSKVD